MTNRNLSQYASEHWDTYKKAITEISKNDKGHPLVESDEKLYNFDLICKNLFSKNASPCSADGITFPRNAIELVEFKSGFKQKITKWNYDPEQAKCPKYHEECTDYYKIFWENQDRKNSELIESIKLKAIESYMILEKHCLACCSELEDGRRSRIVLRVVIDDDGINGIEDVLSDVAGKNPQNNTNNISSIRQALNRFIHHVDANGNEYFYDEIVVLTSIDYLNYLNCLKLEIQ